MSTNPRDVNSGATPPPFRIAPQLHQILYKRPGRESLEPKPEELLPEPPYPQRPDAKEMTHNQYLKLNGVRMWKTWGAPYFKSRFPNHRNELRPIIPYLFTDWKCNLDCHYCWSYDNKVKGMTEDVAKRSIDWLHSIGSRVLALMGGEPLLRPNFIHKVTYYAAKKDFFVYLPTNGRLMKPDVIDRLGDAGLATVNLEIDSVEDRPALPKALKPIMPYFEYLVKNQRRYGYTIAFNTNITRINMEDVKQLAEIAHDNNIAIDFHINE